VEKVVDKSSCRRKARSAMLRPVAGGGGRIVTDERTSELAIDFIAFCFTRRAVGWPQLYDEMCYVAGNRIFRGLGYEELREAGLDFTLGGLGRTSRLANEVTRRLRATEASAVERSVIPAERSAIPA